MKHVFIVNPVSGKANAALTLVPQIVEAAAGLGADHQVELTQAVGHAAELARRYAQAGPDKVRLYACGGDGTLNEVLEGAFGTGVAVGCVPCGSGNDFIRNFGARQDFLNLKDLMQGQDVAIDMIRTEFGYSAEICSVGLDAQVAYGIPKFRRLPLCGGSMAYNLSIAQQLCGRLGRVLDIEIDGKKTREDCLMVAVCNGTTYGGGFRAAPQARLDDGMLDVLVVHKVGLLRIASLLPVYKNGRHLRDGAVVPELADVIKYHRAREVHVRPADGKDFVVNVDGECTKRPRLSARIAPASAKILLPQALCPAMAL